MYDKVIAHLQRQEEILHVDLRKLRQQIKDRLVQITHINDMEPDMRVEHQREAEIVLDRIMTKKSFGNLSGLPGVSIAAAICGGVRS